MRRGVDEYFGLNQKSRILLIGHSHLMLAVDKQELEKELGVKVSKYCREGVNVSDKKAMVTHFLNGGNADSLKLVIYGVDLASFTGDDLSQNSYELFYPFMDDQVMDSYIKNQASPSEYWLHKLVKSSRFNADPIKNSALRGWMSNWDNYKTNTIDIQAYRAMIRDGNERHIDMNPTLISEFKETIKMITDKGINVMLVNTPTLDLLNQYEPDRYRNIMNWFSDFADKNPLVTFIDFNPKYEADYAIFSDRIHLNQKGQLAITSELIEILKPRLHLSCSL